MQHTICWDCAKFAGDCSWSKDFTPVTGWTAVPTEKQQFRGQPLKSYLVTDCPEFERDAYEGGTIRAIEMEEKAGLSADREPQTAREQHPATRGR